MSPSSDKPAIVNISPEFDEGVPDVIPKVGSGTPVMRRVRFTRADFIKYGFTPGCAGCNALRNGTSAQGHTEQCRERMTTAIATTTEGQNRLQQNEQRTTKIIARQIKLEEQTQQKTAQNISV